MVFCRCGTWYDAFKGFKGTGCPQKPHKRCINCAMINARSNKKCTCIITHAFGAGRHSPINPTEYGCGSSKGFVTVGTQEYKDFMKKVKEEIENEGGDSK